MNDRLYRSRDERMIAGVAGGLAEQFRLDPSLVRVLWVILVIPTGGLALLLYIVMAFVVPEEPAGDARWAAWDRGPGGPAWPQAGAATPATAAGAATPASSAGGDAAVAAGVAPGAGAAAEPAGGSSNAPLGAPIGFPPAGARSAMAEGREAWREQRRAWRDERRAMRREARGGLGPLLFGLILILVGGYFLVRAYVPTIDTDRAWPILLVLIGVVLLVGSVRRSPGPSA